MEIRFIKTSPTQNMTLLIQSPVPRHEQLELAKRLISYDSIYAEQAGFLEEPENPEAICRLQMMAGEFCGNATLSLAAYLFAKEMPQTGEKTTLLLEVSGASDLLECEVEKIKSGFWGSVSMPLPFWMGEKNYLFEGKTLSLFTVGFDGITHIIVPKSLWQEKAKENAKKASSLWESDIETEAFGILLFDEKTMELEPLVCVKNSSLVWEKGCGSGTAAIGAYLAQRKNASLTAEISQPGGKMRITALWDEEKLLSLQLSGHVSIVAEGTAYLDD